MKKWLFVAGLTLSACVPQGESSSSTAQSSASASGSDASASAEPEMVCHRERPTGTTISRRVCRPKGEAASEDAQSAINDLQRRGRQGVPTN